jgi:hypothetical protein
MNLKKNNRKRTKSPNLTKSENGKIMELRYSTGIGEVKIDPEMSKIIKASLDSVSEIAKTLEKEVRDLKEQSESQWLIRQPKYGESKGSKFQHRFGLRIIPPYTIEAFVENTAPYAWAIKVGKTSKTSLKKGSRLADKVLWSPAKKRANKLAKESIEQMIKKIQREG